MIEADLHIIPMRELTQHTGTNVHSIQAELRNIQVTKCNVPAIINDDTRVFTLPAIVFRPTSDPQIIHIPIERKNFDRDPGALLQMDARSEECNVCVGGTGNGARIDESTARHMVECAIQQAVLIFDDRAGSTDKRQIRTMHEMQWRSSRAKEVRVLRLRSDNVQAVVKVQFTIATTRVEPRGSGFKRELIVAWVVRYGTEHGYVHHRILQRIRVRNRINSFGAGIRNGGHSTRVKKQCVGATTRSAHEGVLLVVMGP